MFLASQKQPRRPKIVVLFAREERGGNGVKSRTKRCLNCVRSFRTKEKKKHKFLSSFFSATLNRPFLFLSPLMSFGNLLLYYWKNERRRTTPKQRERERESTNRAQIGSRQKQSNGKARERCGVSRGSPETPPRRALFLGKILLRKILPSSAVPFLERRVVVDARRGRRGRARTDEDEDETMRGRSRWARTSSSTTTTSSTHSARG